MTLRVEGREVCCLLDTGASANFISAGQVERMGQKPTGVSQTVRLANEVSVETRGSVELRVDVGGREELVSFEVLPGCRQPILGFPTLRGGMCQWDLRSGRVNLWGKVVQVSDEVKVQSDIQEVYTAQKSSHHPRAQKHQPHPLRTPQQPQARHTPSPPQAPHTSRQVPQQPKRQIKREQEERWTEVRGRGFVGGVLGRQHP